ncbi:hypothetical protein PG993_014109 [Apiospora rasikravindrae]|uniref:Uncharacterized protein n=1 Tax=Apiospora rasikravindrae TaxID=990691 RepID=A0ABR1RS87_9PEZI
MTDTIKYPDAVAEHLDKRQHLLPDELPLPAELAHLSRDEQQHLDRCLTKILDMTLMPVVFILFLLNILDRNNIASAKISGLTTTLGMTNSEYNTCLLMFYIGYCITQMSCWYTRAELPPRIAILYGGNMIATAFSGLIAAGITSRMEGAAGRPAWEWLFIIEGSLTVVIAIILLPLLTDYPLQSKHLFLSRELQLYAEYRVRKENAGIVDEDPESIWRGLRQAIVDPKLYMFVVMQMALITAQSFSIFFPSIVGTLGYDREKTLLLTSPPYFFAFFVSLAVSFHAARAHERGYHIAIPMLFALFGNILAMFVPTTGGRYFSMFLMTAGSYSPYNLVMSWVGASLPRPRAKRAAALAIVNLMSAGVSHFYTSYMFPDSQKPRYYAGGAVMSGACLVCAAAAWVTKRHLRQQNARFDKEEGMEARGETIARDRIQCPHFGHGGGAVVAFRYVH